MLGVLLAGSILFLEPRRKEKSVKMVHDRLQGVEMEGRSQPKKGMQDPISAAEEDVLSSLDTRAPKEHQIGEVHYSPLDFFEYMYC